MSLDFCSTNHYARRIDSLNVDNKVTLAVGHLVVPSGTCGAVIASSKNGKSLKTSWNPNNIVCHRGECTTFIPPVIYLYVPNRCSSHLVAIISLQIQIIISPSLPQQLRLLSCHLCPRLTVCRNSFPTIYQVSTTIFVPIQS